MTTIQILASSASLFFLFIVLSAVYHQKLREAYALVWLTVACFILSLSVSERLLHLLAELVGIKTPAFALLSCLLFGMLFLIFQMTLVISRHNEKITRLAEELALLKEEMKKK